MYNEGVFRFWKLVPIKVGLSDVETWKDLCSGIQVYIDVLSAFSEF